MPDPGRALLALFCWWPNIMNSKSLGFTLLELTVVLLILIALAGVVVPFVHGTVEQTACQATDATLAAVKEAIMGGPQGPGYFHDMGEHFPEYKDSGGDHYHLHFLFATSTFTSPKQDLYPSDFKPSWRGPYLQGGGKLPSSLDASFDDPQYVHFKHTDFKEDFFVLDHYRWRNPIVLQVPDDSDCSNYSSYTWGKNWCARLVSAGPDGKLDTKITDADASARGDDRVLFLRIPDPKGNLSCVKPYSVRPD
jgi:Tfp pilus assembly protein PilE